jgi:hypothetical protein
VTGREIRRRERRIKMLSKGMFRCLADKVIVGFYTNCFELLIKWKTLDVILLLPHETSSYNAITCMIHDFNLEQGVYTQDILL